MSLQRTLCAVVMVVGWGAAAAAHGGSAASAAGEQKTQARAGQESRGGAHAGIVWAMPPGQPHGEAWAELFAHPDQWTAARARTTVLGYADHNLGSQFTDEQLRAQFAQMRAWGLPLGMEVGAVKEWGPTGAIAFAKSRKTWDRLLADGAPISAIAMDEPLACAVNRLAKPGGYAVEETAAYVALVRKNFPDWKVGDIEPYPAFNAAQLLAFWDAVELRLKAMHVRGLDFVRLDVDWMNFEVNGGKGNAAGAGGWPALRELETQVHQRGLPFSLVYWAADEPSLRKKGKATEATWEQGVMHEAEAYRKAGGVPDEFVIESWVGAPAHSVPETEAGTFMRSVDDFVARYVEAKR